MQEIKRLSDKVIKFRVEKDFEVSIPEGETEKTDKGTRFTYYRVTTRDDVYRIAESKYSEKLKAINGGAKFVELENDIVNINEIRKFEKKVAYKSPEYFGEGVVEIDLNDIK
jgi:hypothetical protein